jgi:hypothetical protein
MEPASGEEVLVSAVEEELASAKEPQISELVISVEQEQHPQIILNE